eukprot:4244397-Amphidinium_carterae.1
MAWCTPSSPNVMWGFCRQGCWQKIEGHSHDVVVVSHVGVRSEDTCSKFLLLVPRFRFRLLDMVQYPIMKKPSAKVVKRPAS